MRILRFDTWLTVFVSPKGCKPAIGMALKDVNNSPNLLPGYHLVLHHNDSKVSDLLRVSFCERHNFIINEFII